MKGLIVEQDDFVLHIALIYFVYIAKSQPSEDVLLMKYYFFMFVLSDGITILKLTLHNAKILKTWFMRNTNHLY